VNYFGIKSTKLQFICICQVAVHQECYGAKNLQDFTSWVCRVCETPDVERECCLCPVKGMSSTFNTFFGLTVFAVLLHYIKLFSSNLWIPRNNSIVRNMQFSIHIMIGLTLSRTNQSMHIINLAHFRSY
jgi:hypothetical protein